MHVYADFLGFLVLQILHALLLVHVQNHGQEKFRMRMKAVFYFSLNPGSCSL